MVFFIDIILGFLLIPIYIGFEITNVMYYYSIITIFLIIIEIIISFNTIAYSYGRETTNRTEIF